MQREVKTILDPSGSCGCSRLTLAYLVCSSPLGVGTQWRCSVGASVQSVQFHFLFFQVEGRAEDGGSSLTIMGNQPTQKKITDKVVVAA